MKYCFFTFLFICTPLSAQKISEDVLKLLFDSCEQGDISTIKQIVETKKSIFPLTDSTETTLLLYALIEEQNEITEYLIESECDINIPDAAHTYPLHLAVDNDNFELVALLLKHGALTQVFDEQGNLPLTYARTAAIVKLLLMHEDKGEPSLASSKSLTKCSLSKEIKKRRKPRKSRILQSRPYFNLNFHTSKTMDNISSLLKSPLTSR